MKSILCKYHERHFLVSTHITKKWPETEVNYRNNNSLYLKMILIGARFTQVITMRLNKGRQDIVFIDIRKKKISK